MPTVATASAYGSYPASMMSGHVMSTAEQLSNYGMMPPPPLVSAQQQKNLPRTDRLEVGGVGAHFPFDPRGSHLSSAQPAPVHLPAPPPSLTRSLELHASGAASLNAVERGKVELDGKLPQERCESPLQMRFPPAASLLGFLAYLCHSLFVVASLPQVCREYQRGACKRPEGECRFAHPPLHVQPDAGDGLVTVCMVNKIQTLAAWQ